MKNEEISLLLKKHRLSVTDSRKRILELFQDSSTALAHHDIEKLTGERFDRVTVYRTLQTFIEKGIIHTIPTTDNGIRYALCKEACEEGHHHDDHVHFVCDSCGATTCLENVHIPDVRLPRGYKMRQVDMVVSGLCKDCSGG
jgi:Fur family transcriptional regulator, ferric uptake regulator